MLTFAPLDAAVGVAAPIVAAFAAAVTPFAGGGATALAIVLFTVAVRLLMSPLTYARVRGERRRAALAPRVAELQRRHRGDTARLATELTALYRAAGASPLAGLLPSLLQIPFFLVMYRLFTTTEVAGRPNGLLTDTLFGVPLGHHLTDGVHTAGTAGLFALLMVVALGLAWWLSRRLRRATAPAATAPGDAAAVIGRLLPLLPYGTVLAVAVLPVAAALYLVTTTAFTAAEQLILRSPSGAAR